MRIEVLLGEAPVAPAAVADRVVVVIDVLRAATTAAMALANGAAAVVPFETVHEATAHARTLDPSTVRLGGERNMHRLPGFDFGNSPLEYTRADVEGRTIVLTTTNGTMALNASRSARACLFAGFVNVQATIDALCATWSDTTRLTIVCAGTERQVSLEDAVCAGRIVREVRQMFPDAERGDGARLTELLERGYRDDPSALTQDAAHARSLASAGFAADVAACLTVDSVPFAVTFHAGRLHRHHLLPA